MNRLSLRWILLLPAVAGCTAVPTPTTEHSPKPVPVVVLPAPTPKEPAPAGPVAPAERQIHLKNFQGDETYTAGASLFVFWEIGRSAVVNLTERMHEKLYFAHSLDGGARWKGKTALPLDAERYLWPLPKAAGTRYRIKVWLERGRETVTAATSGTDFAIRSAVATPKLSVARSSQTGKVEVRFEPVPDPKAASFIRPDGSTGSHNPVEAVLWYTTNGGKRWQTYNTFPAEAGKAAFAGDDGRYGLYMTYVDDTGLSSTPPIAGTQPMARLLIDAKAPQIEVNSELKRGPKPSIEVTWTIKEKNLGKRPIAIYLSDNNGKSWQLAAKDLPNTGSHSLKLTKVARTYRVALSVKDRAGNVARREVTHGVIVDNTAPVTVLIGPSLSSSSEVQLRFVLRDNGGSGVKQSTLWYSRDDGTRWEKYKSFNQGEPITFVQADGSYGLYLASDDWAGNKEPAPRDGTVPQITLQIQNAPLAVKLLTFKTKGSLYRGHTRVDIRWEGVGGYLDEKPVTLEFFDGTAWAPIEGSFPRSGTHPWTVPFVESKLCKIRARLTNRHGASTTDETNDHFVIDSTKPKVRVLRGGISATPPEPTTVVRLDREEPSDTRNIVVTQPDQGTDTTKESQPESKPDPSQEADSTKEIDSNDAGLREPLDKLSFQELLGLIRQAADQGQAVLAQQYMIRALELRPESLEAQSVQAYLHYKSKRYTKARELYQQIIKRDRTRSGEHYMLGLIFFHQDALTPTEKRQSNQSAQFHFEQAMNLKLRYHEARNMIGLIHFRLKEYDKALEAFQEAADWSPKTANYPFNQATAHYRLGNYQDCIDAARIAYAADPTLHRALWYIARSYTQQGNKAAAIEYWEQAIKAYGSSSKWGQLAIAELNAVRGNNDSDE